MKLLLDTHAFLWWRLDAPELPERARASIAKADNEVWVSAVVGWEINIKRTLGRVTFLGTVASAVEEEGFGELPVRLDHSDALASLPLIHQDPFDRLLVAQARIEGMALVTCDSRIREYEGFLTIWD